MSPEMLAGLDGGGRPKVSVTVNGFTFGTSIARMGEDLLLGVSADRREAAGIKAGDVVDVEVVLDTAPRTVDVPDDLAAALKDNPEASAFWDGLSYSARQWHVLQITGAKTAETRTRRVANSISLLN
nr:YdeI/OmpD-associated family protein [Hamadaea tsunoensis]